MQFFHHINIIQAVQVIPAPAYILERPGHIFLPVEVVRLVAQLPKCAVCILDHLGDFLSGG